MIYPRWGPLSSVNPSSLPMTATCSAAVKTPSKAHSGEGHALLFGKLAIWKHVCRGSPSKGLCCVSGGRAFFHRTESSSGREWVQIMYKQEIKQASCILARRQRFSNPTFGGGLGYQWPLHRHPLWGKCTSPGSSLRQNFSFPGVGSLLLLSDCSSPCGDRGIHSGAVMGRWCPTCLVPLFPFRFRKF